MNGATRWHRAVLLGAGLCASAIGPWTLDVGLWKSAVGEARADDAARAFHIPAQPLANALVMFAEQAGLAVMAPADLVRDRTAPAVEGTMPALTALDRLLKGSGLKYLHSGDGALTIAPAGSSKTMERGRGAPQAEVIPNWRLAGHCGGRRSTMRQVRQDAIANHFGATASLGSAASFGPSLGRRCFRGSLAATGEMRSRTSVTACSM